MKSKRYSCIHENIYKHFMHCFAFKVSNSDYKLLIQINRRFSSEMSDIKLCIDCYCDTKVCDTEVCDTPHELVFAEINRFQLR